MISPLPIPYTDCQLAIKPKKNYKKGQSSPQILGSHGNSKKNFYIFGISKIIDKYRLLLRGLKMMVMMRNQLMLQYLFHKKLLEEIEKSYSHSKHIFLVTKFSFVICNQSDAQRRRLCHKNQQLFISDPLSQAKFEPHGHQNKRQTTMHVLGTS